MTENVEQVPRVAHDHAEAMVTAVIEGQKAWVEAEQPDVTPEMLRNGAISVVFSLAMSHVISEVATEPITVDELVEILSISVSNFMRGLQENGCLSTASIN